MVGLRDLHSREAQRDEHQGLRDEQPLALQADGAAARMMGSVPLGGPIPPRTVAGGWVGRHRSRRCPAAATTSAMAVESAGVGPEAATFARSEGNMVCSQKGVIDSGPGHPTHTSDPCTVFVTPGAIVVGWMNGCDRPSKGTLVS